MTVPHLVILADDLGFNGVGYRNPELRTATSTSWRNREARGLLLGGYMRACQGSTADWRFWLQVAGSVNNFGHLIAEDGTDRPTRCFRRTSGEWASGHIWWGNGTRATMLGISCRRGAVSTPSLASSVAARARDSAAVWH